MATVGNVNRIPEKTLDFEWKIPDFFSLSKEVDIFYCSPSFSFANESWCLRVYPNGHISDNSVGYIGLYLMRNSSNPPFTLKYSFGLKTTNGKKYKEMHSTFTFEKEETGYGSHKWVSTTELYEKKSELVHNDILTMFCTLEYPESVINASDSTTVKCFSCNGALETECISFHEKCIDRLIKCPDCSNNVLLQDWLHSHECKKERTEGESNTSVSSVIPPKCKTLQDLEQLFLNKENCDVLLRVKGREFSAHKVILMARSPVLASTFRNDMKKKETGIVEIEDCDPSSFSDFLCFLYCGEIERLSEENVFSLFTAADKYDIKDLRTKCLKFMKENVSVDTFCKTITVALQHTETELIHSSTDFFIENAEEIVETVKWQSFAAENPIQSNELFIKYRKSVKH